jgi:acetyl-CoA C-acetyltransferase
MTRDVVIAGYLRTPFSRSKPTKPEVDWYRHLRADELLARLLPEALRRAGVDSRHIDDCIVGSALGIGEQWTYGGRLPVFLADLSESVPAKFVDQQCGSSMAALQTGYLEVAMGHADVVLVAGMEHMTRVPIGPTLYSSGMADLNPRLSEDPALAHWDMATTMNMGMTAEKLFARTGLTREELDAWGVRSHQLASAALEQGFFADEILPVQAPDGEGGTRTVTHDQCIRPGANPESMAQLSSPFVEGGAITAGNASPLNAGASCMLLMDRKQAEKRGIEPLAAVRSMGLSGVDPTVMGEAPGPAAQRALDAVGLEPGQIDYWEINEAFAVVVLHMIRTMGLDPERVNVMGGALALGHAMGATGVRLVGTLARILRRNNARWGCAAACIGGGQGTATVIERI